MHPEQFKTNEQLAAELVEFIPTIEWEMGYSFTFNNIDFTVFITTQEDMGDNPELFGEDAEYHQSSVNSGYDLYFFDTIPAAERPRKMFHEIFEIVVFESSHSTEDAHKTTLEMEEKIYGARDGASM